MWPHRIVSSDSHVVEPPDLWAERIDPAYAERAPRLVAEEHGDWWYADGVRLFSVHGGTETGVRFEGQEKLRSEARFGEVRRGAYLPDAKIADMDADGVYGEVVFPTLGLNLWRLPDGGLLMAIFRAYNDWLADFCRPYPDRIKGIAPIVLDDVGEGVKELERAAKLGLAGALISVYPHEERAYDNPIYDPFWAAAEDLDMPLCLHIATQRRIPLIASTARAKAGSVSTLTSPTTYATADYWVRVSIANLIFSGVFERFPGVKVVSLEHEAGWVPYFLRLMDYTYTQRIFRPEWHRFRDGALPSDFFHRNVFISFQEDPLAVQLRSLIGVDNLSWGSDYPHAESTFPRSREILAEILAGVPEDERAKMVGGNAAALFHFDARE